MGIENMSEQPVSMEKEPVIKVKVLDGKMAARNATIQPTDTFEISGSRVLISGGDREGFPRSALIELLKKSEATRVEITRSGGETEEISLDELAEQLAA
jgi:hypothetical protein